MVFMPSCSGKSSQVPLILSPSQQGQEDPDLLSSCLQSNISANDRPSEPKNLGPITIPAQQAEDHTGQILKLYISIILSL